MPVSIKKVLRAPKSKNWTILHVYRDLYRIKGMESGFTTYSKIELQISNCCGKSIKISVYRVSGYKSICTGNPVQRGH